MSGPQTDAEASPPAAWQAEVCRRLGALGYAGFVFGPGVNWWPIDNVTGQKVAGPFTTTKQFDTWLTEREERKADGYESRGDAALADELGVPGPRWMYYHT
jgi:hypothetical protein